MKFYNSYSKQLEEFQVEGKTVRMYNCGPTVYNHAHIGNFRSFLFADILRRYLEYKGYEVKQVMNFTDVGHMTQDDLEPNQNQGENLDKMALAAQKTGIKDPVELADFFIKSFLEDSQALHCKSPLERPRASEHIQEMQDMIKQLIEKEHAYEVDGFVYFDQSSFPAYGKLSGNTPEDLISGHRVEVDARKKNPVDFSLWKRDEKHLMKWESPWGVGFPGWHIECSAMAMKYLGETLDIHTGGEDNIFPHHEAEIAQSECATSKTFARYWLHARHLLVDNTKMSKSKGNFFTVKDLIQKGYQGEEIRYALICTHYRQKMNFVTGIQIDENEEIDKIREKYSQIEKVEALEDAKTAIKRIENFITALENVTATESKGTLKSHIDRVYREFEEAMDDDLNMAGALGAIFQFIREVNKCRDQGNLSKEDAQQALECIYKFNQVLEILPSKSSDVPEEVLDLVERRLEARKNKNYAEADRLREQIKQLGYVVEDTPQGAICKKI